MPAAPTTRGEKAAERRCWLLGASKGESAAAGRRPKTQTPLACHSHALSWLACTLVPWWVSVVKRVSRRQKGQEVISDVKKPPHPLEHAHSLSTLSVTIETPAKRHGAQSQGTSTWVCPPLQKPRAAFVSFGQKASPRRASTTIPFSSFTSFSLVFLQYFGSFLCLKSLCYVKTACCRRQNLSVLSF